MLLGGDDLADEHAIEGRAEHLDTLDLEPAHGKALDEFVPPCRDVDQFAEPVFAEFHG